MRAGNRRWLSLRKLVFLMSKLWAQVAQLAGAVAFTIGAALVYVPAGWLVGGALLVTIGVGLERGNAE